jgi:hypothetical protein
VKGLGGVLREQAERNSFQHRKITKSAGWSFVSIKKTNFQVTEQAICYGEKREAFKDFLKCRILMASLRLSVSTILLPSPPVVRIRGTGRKYQESG